MPDDFYYDADVIAELLAGRCQCGHGQHPHEVACQGHAIVIRLTTDGMPWWLMLNTSAMLSYARSHGRLVGLCIPCEMAIAAADLSTLRRGHAIVNILTQILGIELGLMWGFVVAPDRTWFRLAMGGVIAVMAVLAVIGFRDYRHRYRPIDGGGWPNDGSHERIDNP